MLYERSVFVVDAYTRRIFQRLGLLAGKEDYESIRRGFETALGPDVSLYTLVIERLLPLIGSGKVLFIAPRRELLDQTAEKLGQHLPGLAIGIDQGERRADPSAQLIIASIQSLSNGSKTRWPGLPI